ncbi:MAG TPA: penicillin-binding transpeptidase domain-containing protein, partial [Gemmatimonadaceae bacterium]
FLYAVALDQGYTAATVLADVPKAYATATGPYRPRNYDRRFHGPTRAREALASSYNVPAVELASRLGAASLLHTLHLAGFTSLDRDAEFYGLGLSLGNGDVTLIELANAYRALANGGEWRDWTWHHNVRVNQTPGRRVVSAMTSAIVLDILNDPTARMPGFGLTTPFDFPFPVAVKTGTSRHFTDNWAVGTTKGFTVAVWAGNFSGRPMDGVSGVTGAGPLLHRIVMATSTRYAPGALPTPESAGAVPVPVCRLSGMRASSTCAQMTEWFAPGSEPKEVDTWERDGRVALPAEYAEWSANAVLPESSKPERRVAVVDTTAPKPAPSRFRIVSPLNGDRYSLPPGVEAKYATIALRANGPGAERVEWTVDGKDHAGDRWSLAAGIHVIAATSAQGDTARVRIVVEK